MAPEDDDGNAAAKAAPLKTAVHSPTDGAMAALSAEDQATAKSIASRIVDLCDAGKEFAAYEAYYQSNLAPEIMLAIWEFLRPHTKIRSTLKTMNKTEKVAA